MTAILRVLCTLLAASCIDGNSVSRCLLLLFAASSITLESERERETGRGNAETYWRLQCRAMGCDSIGSAGQQQQLFSGLGPGHCSISFYRISVAISLPLLLFVCWSCCIFQLHLQLAHTHTHTLMHMKTLAHSHTQFICGNCSVKIFVQCQARLTVASPSLTLPRPPPSPFSLCSVS